MLDLVAPPAKPQPRNTFLAAIDEAQADLRGALLCIGTAARSGDWPSQFRLSLLSTRVESLIRELSNEKERADADDWDGISVQHVCRRCSVVYELADEAEGCRDPDCPMQGGNR